LYGDLYGSEHWEALVNAALNFDITYVTELDNIPISSQLSYVTMETRKTTGDLEEGKKC
jgi:hypothetical protein